MPSETEKSKARRVKEGFFEKYINGKGIDIGCGRTYKYSDDLRIHQSALAHDKDICDAHLMETFKDEEFDYVYASHVLEHLEDPRLAIKNWFRICKKGGYMIIVVPLFYRFEKKDSLPSLWDKTHKKFYSFANFFEDLEKSLEVNSYTVEYAKDCYEGYNWDTPPEVRPTGEYQLECVIRKR